MRDVASDRREPGRGKRGFCPRPSESSWPWAPSCGHPTSGAEATELASAATPQRSRAAPAPADSAVGLGVHRQLESENRPVTPPASELRREPQKAEVLGCAAAGPLRGKRPGQPLARPASRGLRDLRCVPRGIQRVLIPPGRPGRRELPRQVPMALARPHLHLRVLRNSRAQFPSRIPWMTNQPCVSAAGQRHPEDGRGPSARPLWGLLSPAGTIPRAPLCLMNFLPFFKQRRRAPPPWWVLLCLAGERKVN